MEDERKKRSYDGEMMKIGTDNEDILIAWFMKLKYKILDNRDHRFSQLLDVDIAIENKEGFQKTLEMKSDKHIHVFKNLFFEVQRINHFATDEGHRVTLGWGWRSPASHLVVRNPGDGKIFILPMGELRKRVNEYIKLMGRDLELKTISTDTGKTTIGVIVRMMHPTMLKGDGEPFWSEYQWLNNEEYFDKKKTI